MKSILLKLIYLILIVTTFSCATNESELSRRLINIKKNLDNKSVPMQNDNTPLLIIDKSDYEYFIGGQYEFFESGKLKQYSFLTDSVNATYIEYFNDKGKNYSTCGNPIVYSYSSADKAKDSIYIKRYFSTFLYKDVRAEFAGKDGNYKLIKLKDEPSLSFIQSFELLINVKELNRFVCISKFTGKNILDNSIKTFYDTLDITRKKPINNIN